MAKPIPAFLNRILSLRELMQKHSKIQAKTWQNHANLKQQSNFLSLCGVETSMVRFLEDDEQMTLIRDENGDDAVSLSTYSLSSVNA
jgi:hypothetical protein